MELEKKPSSSSKPPKLLETLYLISEKWNGVGDALTRAHNAGELKSFARNSKMKIGEEKVKIMESGKVSQTPNGGEILTTGDSRDFPKSLTGHGQTQGTGNKRKLSENGSKRESQKGPKVFSSTIAPIQRTVGSKPKMKKEGSLGNMPWNPKSKNTNNGPNPVVIGGKDSYLGCGSLDKQTHLLTGIILYLSN